MIYFINSYLHHTTKYIVLWVKIPYKTIYNPKEGDPMDGDPKDSDPKDSDPKDSEGWPAEPNLTNQT